MKRKITLNIEQTLYDINCSWDRVILIDGELREICRVGAINNDTIEVRGVLYNKSDGFETNYQGVCRRRIKPITEEGVKRIEEIKRCKLDIITGMDLIPFADLQLFAERMRECVKLSQSKDYFNETDDTKRRG